MVGGEESGEGGDAASLRVRLRAVVVVFRAPVPVLVAFAVAVSVSVTADPRSPAAGADVGNRSGR